MRPEERDLALLWDLLQEAQGLSDMVRSLSESSFRRNRDSQLIVERRLEIMGEITKRISPATKQRIPEVPWARIVSQRNVIAHEYGVEIDQDLIWLTLTEGIPPVIEALSHYMKAHPPDPEP